MHYQLLLEIETIVLVLRQKSVKSWRQKLWIAVLCRFDCNNFDYDEATLAMLIVAKVIGIVKESPPTDAKRRLKFDSGNPMKERNVERKSKAVT